MVLVIICAAVGTRALLGKAMTVGPEDTKVSLSLYIYIYTPRAINLILANHIVNYVNK